MTFTATDLLRWQFGVAHRMLENRDGGGCADAVVGEDVVVAGVLGGGAPLALAGWAGRTGLSELPPTGAAGADREAWTRRVRVDAALFRPYARAVHAATDAYLAALPDGALDPRARDSPACLIHGVLVNLFRASRTGDRPVR